MLRIERDPRGIATLILDRPAERNALCAELTGRLTEALTSLAGERGLRVVLLTGAGSAFCAGADIAEMRAAGAAAQAGHPRRFLGAGRRDHRPRDLGRDRSPLVKSAGRQLGSSIQPPTRSRRYSLTS